MFLNYELKQKTDIVVQFKKKNLLNKTKKVVFFIIFLFIINDIYKFQ